MTTTVTEIVAAHRGGKTAPADTIRRCYERIRAVADPGIFITLRDEAAASAEAETLSADKRNGRLFGVPFSVKDNIDVAGLPTIVACPDFAYIPRPLRDRSPDKLLRAGRPCSSARPISINSPPAWSARARLMACRATPCSARITVPADRARARPWLWRKGSSPFPWARTRPVRAACRRRSTTSSG